MRAVAVVGFSESGKTRLIVRIIRELKSRGLRVAAVKRCAHGFTLDTEGKDTSEFGRAGADGVAMVSPEGWAALGPAADDALSLASRLFPGVDIVLIEGGKDIRGTPKIEVRRSGSPAAPAARPEELLAIVTDEPPPHGREAPVFGPDDIAGLTERILSLEEANMADITLEVDGRDVNMNAFVRTFIEKTVLGMVSSLSGVDPDPKKITLVIDRAGQKRQPGPKP